MMKNMFFNSNGNAYYILFGKIGETAFLCDINKDEYIIVAMLEQNSWYHGNYFYNFEDAYNYWRRENG